MYQHIVASIDESDNANLALEQAIEIAKLSGATLHLVHIVNLFELALEEYVLADKSKLEALAQEHGAARLEPAAAHVRAAGLVPECYVTNCWGGGDEIADCLLEYGHSVKAGLLVLGFAAGQGIPSVKVNRLLLRNVSVVGVGYGEFIRQVPGSATEIGAGLAKLVDGGLRPPEPVRFPLASGAEALQALADGKIHGKAVLEP